MKIFLSFLQSEKTYPIPAYSFWRHYLKNGIEEAGYQWAECPGCDWALGLVPQPEVAFLEWRRDIWEKTVSWLKKHPADLFLSYLYPKQVDETAVRQIQSMGIPCVNFFCDNVRQFKSIPREYKVFDLNWVPEYKAGKLYENVRYPYLHLPMPMWVEPRYRVFKPETNDQITFIGSKDIQRKLLFENLLNHDSSINLAIYGSGWIAKDSVGDKTMAPDYTLDKKIRFNLSFIESQGFSAFLRKLKYRNTDLNESSILSSKTHRSLSFEEYNRLTAQSMITLGVNRFSSFRYPVSKPGSYSRLRDIEAPMLGACYLTEYTDGIEELFDIENEIMIYRNEDELSEKVAQLIIDFNTRKKLKINGQRRALTTNSITSSLNKIVQKVV